MAENGYRLFTLDERTARKVHCCIWCGEPIEVGAKYLDERSVYDGCVQRQRWHPECLPAYRAALREAGDEGFWSYQNERPAMKEEAAP